MRRAAMHFYLAIIATIVLVISIAAVLAANAGNRRAERERVRDAVRRALTYGPMTFRHLRSIVEPHLPENINETTVLLDSLADLEADGMVVSWNEHPPDLGRPLRFYKLTGP